MFKSFLFAALLGVVSLVHAEEPKPEPSQYQALANTANEVLTKAIEVATAGGQFLEEQVPLVVQELILWKTVIGFFWAVFFLLPSYGVWKCLKIQGWTRDGYYGDTLLTDAGWLAIINVIPLIMSALFFEAALKWLLAPRVALIEYAASMVK